MASNDKTVDDQKVNVGNFTFVIKSEELKKINEKIGDVLEAQIIFRGSDNLGFGTVSVKSEEEAAAAAPAGDDEITGSFGLAKRGSRSSRARGAKSGRGSRRTAGRARRSADDPDSQNEGTGNAATSEAAAQNGEVSVKAVTDGLAGAAISEGNGEAGAKSARGGKKGTRGGRAARAPRQRGEPSKTLVFIRNLPYSYTEADVQELFKSNGLTYNSVSRPTWKFGAHKGKGRGYAFATVDDQEKVLEVLNGKEIVGHTSAAKAPEGNPEAVTATEGEEKPTTRTFKLVARQGYENEEAEKAVEEHEETPAADKPAEETAA